MSENRIFYLVKIFSIIGIGLAIFLLWEQFFHPTFQPCNINSSVNCDAIISGGVSKTLGIPTPLYGLIGYIVILVAAFLKKKPIILGMALFGLVFCLRIAVIELFELHVICPVCLACQIDMIIVTVLGAILVLKKRVVVN